MEHARQRDRPVIPHRAGAGATVTHGTCIRLLRDRAAGLNEGPGAGAGAGAGVMSQSTGVKASPEGGAATTVMAAYDIYTE